MKHPCRFLSLLLACLLCLGTAFAQDAPQPLQATLTSGDASFTFSYPADAALETMDPNVNYVYPNVEEAERPGVMIELLPAGQSAAERSREYLPEQEPVVLSEEMQLYAHRDVILTLAIDRPDGTALVLQTDCRSGTTGVYDALLTIAASVTDAAPLAAWLETHLVHPATLYYNPDGGSRYHFDPNCPSVSEKYLPLRSFEAALLNTDPQFLQMTCCHVCND